MLLVYKNKNDFIFPFYSAIQLLSASSFLINFFCIFYIHNYVVEQQQQKTTYSPISQLFYILERIEYNHFLAWLCWQQPTIYCNSNYLWLFSSWGKTLDVSPLSIIFVISSVQSLSCLQIFVTPWTEARQASLSITKSQRLLNSCLSSEWCHTTISSSIGPFSSSLQSFPASGSFLMSHY